jgi:hypothetical protein
VKYCNDLNAGNSLTSVPDGYFKQLPNLTSIDLYGNRLDEDALKVLRDVTRRRHKWFKLEGPPSGKPSGYN